MTIRLSRKDKKRRVGEKVVLNGQIVGRILEIRKMRSGDSRVRVK